LDRAQKAAAIEEIADQIKESEAVFAVDYRGISVPQAAELRTALRGADSTFRITKNTLTERAADQAGAEALKEHLEGPTALTLVRGDAASAAKAIADFTKANGILTFKGGWMDGAPLTADEILSISRLPSREVLHGRLVGMIASPLTGLAAGLSNLISGLGRQLAQMAEQGLVGGDAPAPAAEPAAEAEAPAQSDPEGADAPADEPTPEAAEEATDEVVAAEDEITENTDEGNETDG
jgi:large subunit ribosomal protein L10